VNSGDLVEILPEFLDEDDPHSTGIIIRESLWDDGYRSSADSWWVVLRGDKLVQHPIDTFRKII
jgi:hypothetical protein